MNRIYSLFKLKKLGSKMAVLMFLNIILISTALGVFASEVIKELSIKNISDNHVQYIKEISTLVQNDVNELESYIEMISYSQQLNDVLKADLLGTLTEARYKADYEIEYQIRALERNKNIVSALAILDMEDGVLTFIFGDANRAFRLDFNEYIHSHEMYMKISSERSRRIYGEFSKVEDFISEFDNKVYLKYWMPISNLRMIPNHKCVGMIYVLINSDYFFEKIKRLVPDIEMEFYIFDMDRKIIAGKDKESFGTLFMDADISGRLDPVQDHGHFIYDHEGRRYLVGYSLNKELGWYFLEKTPLDRIIENTGTLGRNIFYIATTAVLCFCFIAFIEIRKVLQPLRNLFIVMEKIKKGNSRIRVENLKDDEVGSLGKAFNEMMNRLDEIEREKFKHQIDALQAQIHPHFLYNTLNTIRILAIYNKTKELRYAITSIIKLFKFTIGNGETFITLNKELEILEHYINLQKIRLDYSFTVEYEISGAVRPCSVYKLMLQPIVENAVFYGISPMGSGGKIRIVAFREGENLVLKVMDNGKGMEQELIDRVLRESTAHKETFSSMGLYNINQRIRIYFGMQYGIHIESEVDQGTCVTLTLPAIYGCEADL